MDVKYSEKNMCKDEKLNNDDGPTHTVTLTPGKNPSRLVKINQPTGLIYLARVGHTYAAQTPFTPAGGPSPCPEQSPGNFAIGGKCEND